MNDDERFAPVSHRLHYLGRRLPSDLSMPDFAPHPVRLVSAKRSWLSHIWKLDFCLGAGPEREANRDSCCDFPSTSAPHSIGDPCFDLSDSPPFIQQQPR